MFLLTDFNNDIHLDLKTKSLFTGRIFHFQTHLNLHPILHGRAQEATLHTRMEHSLHAHKTLERLHQVGKRS